MKSLMKFVRKNKKFVIIGLVVLFVVGIGVFFMFEKNGGSSSSSSNTSIDNTAKPIKVIQPEDIGLTLVARSDNKAIIMDVGKLSGISTIEYEVTYDANVTASAASEDGGQSGITQRGVIGTPIPVNGAGEIKRTIELGTCSRNVCKYDDIASPVKFVVKVTYSNGDVGSVEKSITL